MKSHYLPFKVLNKQYADKLMAGEVFMRQLGEFGCWNNCIKSEEKDPSLKEGMRSDMCEGTCFVAAKGENDPYGFVQSIPDQMKDMVLTVAMVEERQRFTKLFCMTKLDYDASTKSFLQIDQRLSELGDTVVIIFNPAEFYQRLENAYAQQYANLYQLSSNVVEYRSLFNESREWDVFTKSKQYQWQNEVRIAARIRDDLIVQDPSKMENNPIINIGDMSDIAVEVPLSDLFEKHYPEVLSSAMVQKVLNTEYGMADGLTGTRVSIVGEFREIEPINSWITHMQRCFDKEDWIPVTFMQAINEGGQPIPRLMFVNNKTHVIVKFGWNEIFFESCEGDLIEVDFIKNVFECCFEKTRLPLVGVAVEGVYNLGDVTGKYARYNALETMVQIFENGLLVSEKMGIGIGTEQNLFGANSVFTKWQYTVAVDTSISWRYYGQTLQQIVERYIEMSELIKKRVEMRKGEDMYERFNNLR